MTNGRTRFRISGLQITLLASLCLNVVLGSYLGTQWLTLRRPFAGAAAPARLIDGIASRLPAEHAARLHRNFDARKDDLAVAQADYEAALRRAIVMIADPQFDAVKFRNAVREARDKRVAVSDIVIDAVVETTADIPAQTRAELVSRLKSR